MVLFKDKAANFNLDISNNDNINVFNIRLMY